MLFSESTETPATVPTQILSSLSHLAINVQSLLIVVDGLFGSLLWWTNTLVAGLNVSTPPPWIAIHKFPWLSSEMYLTSLPAIELSLSSSCWKDENDFVVSLYFFNPSRYLPIHIVPWLLSKIFITAPGPSWVDWSPLIWILGFTFFESRISIPPSWYPTHILLLESSMTVVIKLLVNPWIEFGFLYQL